MKEQGTVTDIDPQVLDTLETVLDKAAPSQKPSNGFSEPPCASSTLYPVVVETNCLQANSGCREETSENDHVLTNSTSLDKPDVFVEPNGDTGSCEDDSFEPHETSSNDVDTELTAFGSDTGEAKTERETSENVEDPEHIASEFETSCLLLDDSDCLESSQNELQPEVQSDDSSVVHVPMEDAVTTSQCCDLESLDVPEDHVQILADTCISSYAFDNDVDISDNEHVIEAEGSADESLVVERVVSDEVAVPSTHKSLTDADAESDIVLIRTSASEEAISVDEPIVFSGTDLQPESHADSVTYDEANAMNLLLQEGSEIVNATIFSTSAPTSEVPQAVIIADQDNEVSSVSEGVASSGDCAVIPESQHTNLFETFGMSLTAPVVTAPVDISSEASPAFLPKPLLASTASSTNRIECIKTMIANLKTSSNVQSTNSNTGSASSVLLLNDASQQPIVASVNSRQNISPVLSASAAAAVASTVVLPLSRNTAGASSTLPPAAVRPFAQRTGPFAGNQRPSTTTSVLPQTKQPLPLLPKPPEAYKITSSALPRSSNSTFTKSSAMLAPPHSVNNNVVSTTRVSTVSSALNSGFSVSRPSILNSNHLIRPFVPSQPSAVVSTVPGAFSAASQNIRTRNVNASVDSGARVAAYNPSDVCNPNLKRLLVAQSAAVRGQQSASHSSGDGGGVVESRVSQAPSSAGVGPSTTVALSIRQQATTTVTSMHTNVPKYNFKAHDSVLLTDGYPCTECGDVYALKSSLEFHLQRRSVLITVRCIPCARQLQFFNQCRYKEHIRQHKKVGYSENDPVVVPASYQIRSLPDELQNNCFDAASYARFGNLKELYEYEFCGTPLSTTTAAPLGNEQPPSIQKESSVTLTPNAQSHTQTATTFSLAAPPSPRQNTQTSAAKAVIRPTQNCSQQQSGLKCSECSLSMANAAALHLHFAYNLPPNQKQFICNRCQAVYFSCCSYKAHCRIHSSSNSGPFICSECGCSLASMPALTAHVLTHRSKPTVLDAWRCQKCNTFYSAWEALIAHVAASHCESYVKCPACPKAFRSQNNWAEHKAAEHPSLSSVTSFEEITTCPSCQAVCRDRSQLVGHIRKHYSAIHPFQVFRCPLCGRLMENKSGLLTHYRNVHKINLDQSKVQEYRAQDEKQVQENLGKVGGPASTKIPTQSKAPSSGTTRPFETPVSQPPPQRLVQQVLPQPITKPQQPCGTAGAITTQVEPQNKSNPAMVEPSSQQTAPQTSATLSPVVNGNFFVCPYEKALFFRSEDALRKHIEQKHALLCRCCKTTFLNKEERFADGIKHIKENSLVCLLCDNTPYENKSKLAAHLPFHTSSSSSFLCAIHCNTNFVQRNEAINHLRAVHLLDELKCGDCNALMDSEKSLDVHKWVCSNQSRSAGNKRSNDRSSNTESSETLPQKKQKHYATSIDDDSLLVITCKKCCAKIQGKEAFLKHIKQHREPGYLQCLECGICFASESSISRHLISAHKIKDVAEYLRQNGTKPTAEGLSEFQCDVCRTVCENHADLVSHRKTHGLRFLRTKKK